jgi:outer membrane protein TolC
VAAADYARSERELAAELAAFAAEVESAWITAVAAEQVAQVHELGRRAAVASAELAQRYFDAGNISRLQLAGEQAAAAEARIEALRATGAARQARLKLAALMGLPSGADWTLPARLPIPPAEVPAIAALQRRAHDQRLDLAAADRAVAAAEASAAGARQWRWLGGLDLGIARDRGPGDPIQRGPTIALSLPWFGQGVAAVARADAEVAATTARRADLALAIDHEVALAMDQLDGARQIVALHRDALLPAREAIVARTQEKVNYMLVGSFELLAERRAAYGAYQSYLEALRDYGLARVALARAVGGPLDEAAADAAASAGAEDLLPPPEDHSHMHHGEHR